MGKTIAVKLSEKEDQIIKQLNKQGISNSELLRNALRQYFEYLQESTSQEQQGQNSELPVNHHLSTVHESFEALKQEVKVLQEQTRKIQEQIDCDITGLQKQLEQLSIKEPVTKQIGSYTKTNSSIDIHYEVDEFLKKRSQCMDR